jgi:hypothetical protein
MDVRLGLRRLSVGDRVVGDATSAYALINIPFRLLIWVLPVFGIFATSTTSTFPNTSN